MGLKKDLSDEIASIEEKTRVAVIFSVLDGIRYLNQISPAYTGWYARNHRVGLGSSPTELDPPTRPPGYRTKEKLGPSLALSDADLITREFPNIQNYKVGEDIMMTNTVPYADEIENGTRTRPEGKFYARAEQYIAAKLNEYLVQAGVTT